MPFYFTLDHRTKDRFSDSPDFHLMTFVAGPVEPMTVRRRIP